jgi:(p)ppGpp synthase/HD superfamily hydrolase
MKQRAKAFAENAHKGQYRKSAQIPYITHPTRVAERLESIHSSDELVCAAYLHDVVEDTPFEIEDIESKFGQRVAHLVSAHTEDKSQSWQERKQHTIDIVKDAEKEVKYLIVADRLDNLLDLERNLQQIGEHVWNHFNAPYEKQKWYNESIAKNMYIGLAKEDIPEFFNEFEQAIKRVFG